MSTEAHIHGEPEHDPADRPRRRRLVAVSVAAAVVLAAGGTYVAQALVGGGGSSSDAPAAQDKGGDPEPLQVDGYGGAAESDKGSEPSYKLSGDAGKGPDKAPVYRPSKVDAKAVAELARALGVQGKPVKRGETWLAGEGRSGPVLRVSGTAEGQQGQWSFSRYSPTAKPKCGKIPQQPDKPPRCPSLEGSSGLDPDTPVSSDGVPARDGAAEPARGQDPVSEDEAKKAAGPVLRELGLEKADLDASATVGALRTVKAQPTLDGLSVQGWDTRLTVGSDGEVVRGNGPLAPLAKGATYPVLGAEETLAELNKHRPVHTEIQCIKEPCDGPKDGPAKIDKASFVLAAHSSQGKRVLVPSWRFELGAGKSVSYPAVEPRLLAKDSPKDDPSGNAGDGSRPGSPGTDAPTTPGKPVPPGDGVESYEPGDRKLTVHFWGGACADYSAKALEMKDRVQITIVEKEHNPGAPCIKIAKAMKDEVTLATPIGDRDVVDEKGEKLRER